MCSLQRVGKVTPDNYKASISSALVPRMVLRGPAEGGSSHGVGEGAIRPLESSDTVNREETGDTVGS